ncbi:MAG: hypothetical protein HY223_08215 [Thaumarchaeota archaeon]|nr:hypothetical protein [Nitrososphaerota archaeon]
MARFVGLENKLAVDMREVRKALVMLAIEQALLEHGTPVYDHVVKRLEERYHAYLSDCCENPSYLQDVLKELFGNSYSVIIQSITKNLNEFSDRTQIRRFLDSITT